jgi:hypothetical protein
MSVILQDACQRKACEFDDNTWHHTRGSIMKGLTQISAVINSSTMSTMTPRDLTDLTTTITT